MFYNTNKSFLLKTLFSNQDKLLFTGRFLFILMIISLFTLSTPKQFAFGDNQLFEEAILSYYQGNLLASKERFEQIIMEEPDDQNARLNLIFLLQESGDFEETISHLTYLITKFPTDSRYRLLLMKTYSLAGQARKALLVSEKLEKTADLLLWQGLAYYDLGQTEAAVSSLRLSVDKSSFNPLAYYFLGLLHLEQKEFQKSSAYFNQALKQEPSMTSALYHLAKTYTGLKYYDRAYSLLQRAEAVSPWDQKIKEALNDLVTNHPDLIDKERVKEEKRRETTTPPRVTSFPENREGIRMIRVGLAENVMKIHLKTGAPFTLTESENDSGISGKAGAELLVRSDSGVLEVVSTDGIIICSSKRPLTLHYEDATATTAIFGLEFGAGYYWAGTDDRCYRGEITLLPAEKGLTIINLVNLEEYLYSVVPSEMPSSWPPSALEAQAIAARSYALANIGRYSARGFDLLGSVLSAEYKGVKNETGSCVKAVNATRGMIMEYNGRPVSAFFHANSGGHTETNETVWGGAALPYLQAVPDLITPQHTLLSPYDLTELLSTRIETYSSNPRYSSSAAFRWRLMISREEIEARLQFPKDLGSIVSITTIGRGNSGRVKKVLIKGTTGEYLLTGDLNIRTKLGGLRSTLFTIQPKLGVGGLPEYFLFTGAGWGHGVGMCQSGAAGMAAGGHNYQEILLHYYPGVKITRLY